MNISKLQDKPRNFPAVQVDGAPLKSLPEVLLSRRATAHFRPDSVPEEYLRAILELGGQAPSGYNLQPWRFIIVRDAENRKRLQQAARNQLKVGEAPVVLIAFGIKGEWKTYVESILKDGAKRGLGRAEEVSKKAEGIIEFLNSIPDAVWLSRHTMINFTAMMLLAESYGLDTAPMEGFDPEAVKQEFNLPPDAEVVALLALGFAAEPDKPYGGRLALHDFVHQEHYGHPWSGPAS